MLVSFLVLFVSLATAGDELKDAIKSFEKAFRSSPKRPRTAQQRTEALELLGTFDTAAVAETLIDAYLQVDEEREAIIVERQEILDDLSKMVKGQEFGTRTFERSVTASLKAQRARAEKLRERVDALADLQTKLLERLQSTKDAKAFQLMIDRVVGDRRMPLSLRMMVVRFADEHAKILAPALIRALPRAKKPEEVTLLLEGIARLGDEGKPASDHVLARLEDDSDDVRQQAAFALAQIAVPQSIVPLIDQLERETSELMRKRMAAALEVITHQTFGTSVRTWRRWLENEGQDYVAGKMPLGRGLTALVANALYQKSDREPTAYYYGIPQEGQSTLYLIDCSGSMNAHAKEPKFEGGQAVDAGAESRMASCKDALIKVLGTLPDGHKFNMICFNDLPHLYEERMQVTSGKAVRAAQNWVRTIEAGSSTNIHDTLERAFRMAGRGPTDKYYSCVVDTIFLLTDGTPTKTDGTKDSTEKIVEAVRRWNPYQRVIVHTIGIGKQINAGFLRQLAQENGGQFVGL